MRVLPALSIILSALLQPVALTGHDWPMWRYDYHRSAVTPEQLSDQLHLQWTAKYNPREPVWDDPLNQDLMQFDRLFEPVVSGNRLFIGFNDQDKVVALDLNNGNELWHYYADGPVRLPLALHNEKVYFTGDDGWCYCLSAADGTLLWKRLLAPFPNLLLGNKRMISMWPARGGVVIKEGVVYTAAGVFPMMGTFIYALDAETGEIIWKNESTGSNYILQPHRSPAFADVAPQGAFTISGNRLLVAGGRSVPAAFDLNTGEELYYQLAASGKTGGAFTCANDRVFFNHHRERNTVMYNSETGSKIAGNAGEYPVIEGNTFYFSGKGIQVARLNSDNQLVEVLKTKIPATTDLIKAGSVLYGADSTSIKAVKFENGNEPKILWSYNTEGHIVERLVAANGKLIASCSDGTIMVFGSEKPGNVKVIDRTYNGVSLRTKHVAKEIEETGIKEGYCLLIGTGNQDNINYILSSTSLNIVAVERDKEKIEKLRTYYHERGVSSLRFSIIPSEGDLPLLPKYFSSLTLVNDPGFLNSAEKISELFESTRPYGGKLIFHNSKQNHLLNAEAIGNMNLDGAVISSQGSNLLISRPGALAGASPWTHNYGNIANTIKSEDKLVKAPLGILWFGGNSNMDVLPRHGHGPGEQVIEGRLIIEGINSISARDVYTGRTIWKREFEQLMDDSWLVYYDESYDEENPLDPKYNQEHMSGANSRGTNYIATKEYVYLIEGNKCNVLDINTGETVKYFSTGDANTSDLGYIGVYEDLLILGNNFTEYLGLENDSVRIKNPRFTDFNRTASSELIVLNRFTGKKLYSLKASHGFIHNSIIAGDGMIFCLDKLPQYLETKMRRRGETPPDDSRLLYIDATKGTVLYEQTSDVFGTWLGYSEEHRLLLQATRPSRDMLTGEEGDRMIAYDVRTREKLWDRNIKYANPPILHNDKIYTNGEAFYLLSGEPVTEKDPVTGKDLGWSFKREYGCGIVAASEYLLTFRSASAGFVNLEAIEGTGSLGGWKPGCSTNLIAADGVLNSPDYTRTCQCPYQNQTSLALIHMPWMSYWTNSNYKWDGSVIRNIGLNFNAPGDRSSETGVLWLEYPFVAGASPGIPVTLDTSGYKLIRKEPYGVESSSTPWVAASAIEGVRRIKVALAKEKEQAELSYTVKLYFSEPEKINPGERVFDISIQDETELASFDIVKEAGKTDREVVKSFNGIRAGSDLVIELKPVKGNTIISGIEIISENLSGNE